VADHHEREEEVITASNCARRLYSRNRSITASLKDMQPPSCHFVVDHREGVGLAADGRSRYSMSLRACVFLFPVSDQTPFLV
jgi:hypothetical protein